MHLMISIKFQTLYWQPPIECLFEVKDGEIVPVVITDEEFKESPRHKDVALGLPKAKRSDFWHALFNFNKR